MIAVAVLDSTGKLRMEAILETKAATILQFIRGLPGSLHESFEERTCAAWLHNRLKPHVTEILVGDPRKNALLKSGSKNDSVDARKLADVLRTRLLSSVYVPTASTDLVVPSGFPVMRITDCLTWNAKRI